VLLERTSSTPETWDDVEVDLTAFRGQRVEVHLTTRSPAPSVAFWSNPVLRGPRERPVNVLVVLEDTLRADHLSTYGHPRATSPAKDALAREGVVFERADSQATKTRPSCPAQMTSLYPTATGVWSQQDALHERYLTLAEVLRAQGFATGSIIQNGNAGPVAGLHQGFGTFAYRPEARAELYDVEVRDWIRRHADRNFFLYVHLVDPHSPYDPPPGYRAWFAEPDGSPPVERRAHFDPAWVERPTVAGRQALYDGEIAHNDAHFGDLIEWLRGEGLLDDTLLVFLSDHGEFLGEHGLWEHEPPSYRQVVHVPLLMRYPKAFRAGHRVRTPVQVIDVMPTILEIAGIDAAPLLMQGDSLVSLAAGRNAAHWDVRLAVSEEVTDKAKRNDRPWASVFFRDFHAVNSESFVPAALAEILSSRVDLLHLRVFDLGDDFEEERFANGHFVDLPLKRRIDHFVRELQATNRRIQAAIAPEGAEAPRNREVEAQLRALGYAE
jgi:arylsulfatase A-like enzyme